MIRVGIGGWTYAPWRGVFYPEKLPQARELAFAAERLGTIEINGTFYRTQAASSFAKWRDETPEGFVFSVKGHRSVCNRARLAEGAEAVDWFLRSGLLELGEKLGPILWQLAPHKKFSAEDCAGFFDLLPHRLEGRDLRHAIEVRHESFKDAAFIDLARNAGVAVVYADSAKYPSIADVTGDFVYARLQNAAAEEPTGYAPAALDGWAGRARLWEGGGTPDDLPAFGGPAVPANGRPVFIYMINGAKERAPAAAMGLIKRLSR